MAAKHATCWVRFGDAPDRLREQIAPVLNANIPIGLRLSVIIRSTNDDARAAAAELVAGANVAARSARRAAVRRRSSDAISMQETYRLASDEWPTPALWTGAIPVLGATALALVGDASAVAGGIMEFAHLGSRTSSSRDGPPSLEGGHVSDGSIATGWGKLQVQPCPQCPVSDGRPERGGPVVNEAT